MERRKWQGKLERIEKDMITLIVDDQEQILVFGNIQKRMLLQNFKRRKREMSKEILLAAEAVSNEKLLPREKIFEALESAIAISTKKKFEYETDIRVSINPKKQENLILFAVG